MRNLALKVTTVVNDRFGRYGLYPALAVIYAAVRVAAVAGAPPFGVGYYPDTLQYLAAAQRPLFSSQLWAGIRSPTAPLFYKLLSTPHAIVVGQVTVSILAWLALAVSTRRSTRTPWLGLVAFCGVLLFSLVSWVSQWDVELLSESLTVSLTVGLIAAWLALARRVSWPRVAAVLVVALFWCLARDSDAVVLLFATLGAIVWLVRTPRRCHAAAIVIGFSVIVAATITSADGGQRWKVPLIDVVSRRVLVDPSATAFFERRGMPMPADIRGPLSTRTFPDYTALYAARDWPTFDAWLENSGRGTYETWLIEHPGGALSALWDARIPLGDVDPGPGSDPNASFPLGFYRPTGFRDVIPAGVRNLIYPTTGTVLGLYLLASVLLATVMARRRRAWSRALLIPAAILALSVPHAFAIVLGDAYETPRHALELGITLRLAIWLALVFALDGGPVAPGPRASATTGQPRADAAGL